MFLTFASSRRNRERSQGLTPAGRIRLVCQTRVEEQDLRTGPKEKLRMSKNVSDHVIKINRFTVSSPAVAVKLDKKALNPNDSLDIQITIKADKVGYKNEHLIIETDSKNQSSLEMRISYIGKQE